MKILKPAADARSSEDGFGWGILDSFVLEARLVANLRSSNTVTLYDDDHFKNDEGALVVYMVLEYVPGLDLNRLIQKRGALGPRMTMNIAVQLLKSLAEAHEGTYGDIAEGKDSKDRQPILHRDIKPGNVMVRLDEDDEVIVKVLDFGMSKLLEAPKTARTILGEATGTPGYQSPEQRNRITGLTPASDLFGVGVIMWQCLSGERFPPSRFLADEDIKIGDGLCVGAPALKDIIERLLRFAPHRRYQKAEEVINDINHLKIHKVGSEIFSTALSKAVTENDISETKTLRVISEHSKPIEKLVTTEDDFKTERVHYTGLNKAIVPAMEEESSGEFKIDLVSENTFNDRKEKTKNGSKLGYIFIGFALFACLIVVLLKMLPGAPTTSPEVVVDTQEPEILAPVGLTEEPKEAPVSGTPSNISKNEIVKAATKTPIIVERKKVDKKKRVVSKKVSEVLKEKVETKVKVEQPARSTKPKPKNTKEIVTPKKEAPKKPDKILTLEDYGL